MERLSRGGVYLARLDPAQGAELGKLRPVAVLSAEEVLKVNSPLLFVCPLSSRSESDSNALHVTLPPRDALKVQCYALVEHCRAISHSRLLSHRIAQWTEQELTTSSTGYNGWSASDPVETHAGIEPTRNVAGFATLSISLVDLFSSRDDCRTRR